VPVPLFLKTLIEGMTEKDLPSVVEIERRSFPAPWTEDQFRGELDKSYSRFFIAESEGQIVGYAGVWLVGEEAQLINMAVKEDARRQGVGRRLLAHLHHWSRSAGATHMSLEVREGNQAARRLYEKEGFVHRGQRPRFYEGKETAFLMEKRLNFVHRSRGSSRLLLVGLLLALMASPAGAASGEEPYRLYLRGLLHERFGNPESALADYERVLGLDPEAIYVHEAMAVLSLRLGRLVQALTHAQHVVRLDPKNPHSHIVLGRVYLARGDLGEAIAAFDKALALNPDDDEALLFAAHLRMVTVPQEAVTLYDRFLENNPHSFEARVRLAELHQRMGDLTSAVKSWEKILEMDAKDPASHLALAQVHEIQGETQAAIENYENYRALDPENFNVVARLGELHFRAENMIQAQEAFERAAEIRPDDPTVNFWLALMAERRSDWEEAVGRMSLASEKSAEAGTLLRLAYYYSQSNRGRRAVAILKRLQKQEPENPDFMYYVAMGYEDLGKNRQAIRWLEKVIQKDPERAEAYFHLAGNWDQLKKFDRAVPYLKRVIELNPRHSVALNYLGYTWAERGQNLEEALGLIQRALALEPENGAYLDSLGWVFFKMGRFTEAEKYLEQATRLVDDPIVWEHYGDVLMKTNRKKEALQAWKSSLALDPENAGLLKRFKENDSGMFWGGNAKGLLKHVESNFRQVSTLVGFMELNGDGLGRHFQLHGLFYYAHPQFFRIEVLGPFQMPQALLLQNPEGVHWRTMDPSVDLWRGQEKWLKLLGDFLSGDLLNRFGRAEVQIRKGRNRIRLKASFGEIHLDERQGLLTRMVWKETQGPEKVTYTMTLKDYEEIGDLKLPRVMECKSTKGRLKLTLILHQLKLNTVLDASLFQLSEGTGEIHD